MAHYSEGQDKIHGKSLRLRTKLDLQLRSVRRSFCVPESIWCVFLKNYSTENGTWGYYKGSFIPWLLISVYWRALKVIDMFGILLYALFFCSLVVPNHPCRKYNSPLPLVNGNGNHWTWHVRHACTPPSLPKNIAMEYYVLQVILFPESVINNQLISFVTMFQVSHRYVPISARFELNCISWNV
jgi:hypothetical protein